MFRSFFLAGFEGTTGWNRRGSALDQIEATQHDRFVEGDYRRLSEAGLLAAREAIRWPLVERAPGRWDFSSAEPMAEAAERWGVEVVWDLFHFGYPSHLDPFAPSFADRFADYAAVAAAWVRSRTDGTCWITPVNEPSYLAWAGGEMGLFAPHAKGRGPELKEALVRAAIAGACAVREAAPGARIVHVDPVCHVVPPRDRPDLAEAARHFGENVVFESLDAISGRTRAELGGALAPGDVVAINYYWTNQWELGSAEPLADDDERRVPLAELVRRAWRRYRRPVLIGETGERPGRKAGWIRGLGETAVELLAERVPLVGICLYPALSMPEWHEPAAWAHLGPWTLQRRQGLLERVPDEDALAALRDAAEAVDGARKVTVT